MSLNDFCQEEMQTITRFVVYWCRKHEENPELYPKELGPGEWDEQLTIFAGMEEAQ